MKPNVTRLLAYAAVLAGGALLVSCVAQAQDHGQANGPSWETIATAACAFIVSVVGGYQTAVSRRIGSVERQQLQNMGAIDALEKTLLAKYHNREALKEFITDPLSRELQSLRETVNACHRRLDMFGVPHAGHRPEGG